MGKATGFMDYERQDKAAEAPRERIRHFNEFYTPLAKEEQELQGARCMSCGVPFCQSGQMIMGMASGCPLHNLVPEWQLGRGILPAEKDQQLPGIYRPRVSGLVRGGLYLQPERGCSHDKGK